MITSTSGNEQDVHHWVMSSGIFWGRWMLLMFDVQPLPQLHTSDRSANESARILEFNLPYSPPPPPALNTVWAVWPSLLWPHSCCVPIMILLLPLLSRAFFLPSPCCIYVCDIMTDSAWECPHPPVHTWWFSFTQQSFTPQPDSLMDLLKPLPL